MFDPSHRQQRAWGPFLARLRRRQSVILGYHGLADAPRKDDLFRLQVRPATFRGHLEMLLEAGFRFVTVAELAREAAGGPPTPGLAAVSFDDAMRSVLTAGLPIARELGIRATVYAPSGWLGGYSPWIARGGDGAILTAAELRELSCAGWEVGAHTHSHADLSALDYDGCRREIESSCAMLGELTGVRVETLAYPFGRYGPAAVAAARDTGLIAAVTTGSGVWEPFELTRAMMGPADSFPIAVLKLTGRYESLLSLGPLRIARSASKALRRARLDQRPQV